MAQDMQVLGMDLSGELSRCLILNTVAAARTLLRRYDARLKSFGVTVQQFSLLAAIRHYPEESASALAQRVYLDRTSLIRNLDLLERKKLVRRAYSAVGKVRICKLAKKGDALLDQLLPEWQRAKSELTQGISSEQTAIYLEVAKRLAQE